MKKRLQIKNGYLLLGVFLSLLIVIHSTSNELLNLKGKNIG